MSKELLISIGIPYSGRTTWLNKNYSLENTVIIDESNYENFLKDGKINESSFMESIIWISNKAKEQMELNRERIVISLFQCRPDHWIDILRYAITYEYTFNVIIPKQGYYYYNNKYGRNQEQIDASFKATINKFPKIIKDKKKHTDDEIQENNNLYLYIITEFQSAYAFYLSNKFNFQTDPHKWLTLIEKQYKVAINITKKLKDTIEAKILKENEKITKENKHEINDNEVNDNEVNDKEVNDNEVNNNEVSNKVEVNI
jgi:hypothetical protein